MGEPSGGGSGSARQFQLPRTRLIISLSSMASFWPEGSLFDGNPIAVDIIAKRKLEDFTTSSDAVLARAIAVIVEKSRRWKASVGDSRAFADQVGDLDLGVDDVERLPLVFVDEDERYVRQRALKALARIGATAAE